MPPGKTLSPRFLSSTPRQKEITHSTQITFSDDIFSSAEKGVEDYGARKMTKIKPTTALPYPIF